MSNIFPSLLIFIMCFIASYAQAENEAVSAMSLCEETAESQAVVPHILKAALIKAQKYSLENYGPDCFVCADVRSSDKKQFVLHITSPIEGMNLNTSATITFRASDGKVMQTRKYHSCQARVTSKQ